MFMWVNSSLYDRLLQDLSDTIISLLTSTFGSGRLFAHKMMCHTISCTPIAFATFAQVSCPFIITFILFRI